MKSGKYLFDTKNNPELAFAVINALWAMRTPGAIGYMHRDNSHLTGDKEAFISDWKKTEAIYGPQPILCIHVMPHGKISCVTGGKFFSASIHKINQKGIEEHVGKPLVLAPTPIEKVNKLALDLGLFVTYNTDGSLTVKENGN